MSDSVDEIADALKENPVQVSPLFGNGRTDEVHAELSAIVDDLGFPAYVVLVPQPAGLSANDPDRELATLLHDKIGGDGVYFVQTTPVSHGEAVVAFGDVPDLGLRYEVEQEFRPEGGTDVGLTPAGLVARDLEVLESGGDISRDEFDAYTEQAVWREPAAWEPTFDAPTTGTFAVFITMAFVAVAGSVWLVLRNLARWRATAPAVKVKARAQASRIKASRPSEGPVEVRALAERELDDLAQRLAKTAGKEQSAETRVLVDGSYDTARSILERTGTAARDLDDLVGALVLTRVAARALKPRRNAATPYRPCFFDPRHGEGGRRRTVPVGDRDLSVPACERCAYAKPDALDPMVVRGGLLARERPWYEQDTVWARTGYGAFVDDLWHHVATEQQAAR